MARVTVEDCVLRVPNRFELVMLAAQRARNLGAGTPLTVDRDDDKNPVIALREIAEATVELQELENGLIRGLQKTVEADEPESDELDAIAMQQDILVPELDEAVLAEELAEDQLNIEDDDAIEVGLDDEGPTDEPRPSED